MKTIGIITFHWADNYGALLQASSLVKCLEEDGHRPFLIDYLPGVQPTKIHNLIYGRSIRSVLTKWYSAVQTGKLRKWRGALPKSRTYNDCASLQKSPPQADVYVCGSDQIWNNRLIPGSNLSPYLLDFGSLSTKRIAYGASIGNSRIGDGEISLFTRLLPRFNAVGVREQSGLKLLSRVGFAPGEVVPDPTLLDARRDRIVEATHEQARILAVYMIEPDLAEVKLVVQQARNLGIKSVRNLFMGTLLWGCGASNLVPDVKNWVAELAKADWILTNSFHGTVYALLLRKPFLSIGRKGHDAPKNERIQTLLKYVGLEERLILSISKESTEFCFSSPINWKQVHEKLADYGLVGRRFLARNI